MPVDAFARRDTAPPIAVAEVVSAAGPLDAAEGLFWPVDVAVREGRRRRMLAGVRSVKRAGERESNGQRRAGAGVKNEPLGSLFIGPGVISCATALLVGHVSSVRCNA